MEEQTSPGQQPVDRRTLLGLSTAVVVALAGCTGSEDDQEPTTDDTTPPENTTENGQENGTQNGNDEQEPEYINQENPIEIYQQELQDLDEEPIDIFTGEITQNTLQTEYTLENITGINENPEQNESYETDVETVVELLENDHTEGGETQIRENTTTHTKEEYSEEELTDGIRENTTIPLPSDIRNYTLQTTIEDQLDENNSTDTEELELNFADAYTETRYKHRFQNADNLGPQAELREIQVGDGMIKLDWKSNQKLSDEEGIVPEFSEMIGNYGGIIDTTQTPYGLEITVEDTEGDTYTETEDNSRAQEYLKGSQGTREVERMRRDVIDDLYPREFWN